MPPIDLAMLEATNQTRSFKHDVSLLQLTVDAGGNGEGTLAAGIRIRFDGNANRLVLENDSFAPPRLSNLKRDKAEK